MYRNMDMRDASLLEECPHFTSFVAQNITDSGDFRTIPKVVTSMMASDAFTSTMYMVYTHTPLLSPEYVYS